MKIKNFNRKDVEHKHHWTLNHEEDGEIQMLSMNEHGKIHGITNTLSDEMSIRRDIMFALAEKIPLERMNDVLEEVLKVFVEKTWIRGSRYTGVKREKTGYCMDKIYR